MLPVRHRVATQFGVFPRSVVAHCGAADVAQLVREENQKTLAAAMHRLTQARKIQDLHHNMSIDGNF
jgi:hypothetical protein